MKFIDEAKIWIRSGDGGNGCLSFRREAHTPMGGPDGGNGGRGGHIIFKAVKNINTLIDFRFKKHFRAKNGEAGKGKNRFGKNAEDIILNVPVGTSIYTESDNLIIDLVEEGQEEILLRGGDGGLGNANFKSSRNQAPRTHTSGKEGEEMQISLQLKIISDIGIIGFPNAGKSTLLTNLSRAHPKIADYPFTTLKPELGVVYVNQNEFVMADIPGLIEGASEGVGLGHKFLRHIERCRAVLHLIDVTSNDLYKDYLVIRNELKNYNISLETKAEIIALSKCDLMLDSEYEAKKNQLEQKLKQSIFTISSASKLNLEELKSALYEVINNKEDA
ncbi:MAG: GTPase ObgE [Rickettsiales bacterium]|nr:GTPase ObgE [Rickettsiales bacterium]